MLKISKSIPNASPGHSHLSFSPLFFLKGLLNHLLLFMEAFREAREQFLSGLQPADKELFDNCDNPETLLIEIQKIEDRHRHHSNARKVVEKITPFVQHVEKYGKALDVFSNAKSGILCPIWGATRIILEVKPKRHSPDMEGNFSANALCS